VSGQRRTGENPSWRADVVAGVGGVARRGLPLGSRGLAGLGRFGGRSHLAAAVLRCGGSWGSGARRGARELYDWQKPFGGRLARARAGSEPRSSGLASSESWERTLVEGGAEGSAEPEAKPDGNQVVTCERGGGCSDRAVEGALDHGSAALARRAERVLGPEAGRVRIWVRPVCGATRSVGVSASRLESGRQGLGRVGSDAR
jgi:hypothetical protein